MGPAVQRAFPIALHHINANSNFGWRASSAMRTTAFVTLHCSTQQVSAVLVLLARRRRAPRAS
jgi:hypothetical protein